MRGASRASFAAARERLFSVETGPDAATAIADELFAVTGLLDREPALRRAMTDPTSPQAARAGLARDVFGARVSPATVDLVAGMASTRWAASRDLADAAEELAVLATAADAERQGQLDDLEDELFRFGRIVNAEPELRAVLSNPLLPSDGKRRLLDTLLAGKVTPTALRLITQAAVYPRGRGLDASLDTYARLAADWRQRLIAVVRVAAGLTGGQRERLAAALARIYGRDVHLNVLIDPGAVGGMSIQIGDEFIDGTMASRLAQLRHRLAS